jgi:hypothetical protein
LVEIGLILVSGLAVPAAIGPTFRERQFLPLRSRAAKAGPAVRPGRRTSGGRLPLGEDQLVLLPIERLLLGDQRKLLGGERAFVVVAARLAFLIAVEAGGRREVGQPALLRLPDAAAESVDASGARMFLLCSIQQDGA